MSKQKIINTINETHPNYAEAQTGEMLYNELIKPFEELGWEFELYQDNVFPTGQRGTHTIILQHPTHQSFDNQEYTHLMFGDDSQPVSTYTQFYGTLYIYLPYEA